jgi:hypothetical protein
VWEAASHDGTPAACRRIRSGEAEDDGCSAMERSGDSLVWRGGGLSFPIHGHGEIKRRMVGTNE